jgi:hypothetical protein
MTAYDTYFFMESSNQKLEVRVPTTLSVHREPAVVTLAASINILINQTSKTLHCKLPLSKLYYNDLPT